MTHRSDRSPLLVLAGTGLGGALLLWPAAGRAQEPPPLAADAPPAEAKGVTVRVNPAVELLSVVFRLAGNREYNQGKVERYTQAVEAHFRPHAEHEVVRLAADLRNRQAVSYDAVMGLAVHLDGSLDFKPAMSLQPRPAALDARWGNKAPRFVRALQSFAKAADFEGFWRAQQPLYEAAAERMRQCLREGADLSWFDQFFGERPTARFELSLGMLNGGACYGPRVLHRDGREDLHCVLGVWQVDESGSPAFDEDVITTVVHEFCHSYCNHLVDAHEDALRGAGTALWPKVAEAMRQQAYSNWQTMLKESLVRASVIRYQATQGGPAAEQREAREQEQRSFLWAKDLADLLAEYEASREQFPDLAAFMPRVVAFFDDYAATFEQREAEHPKVVAMVPANGADDVDPGLASIVITFDRPMQAGSWSLVGGGPTYPKTGQPSYDDECKVLTLPVQLEPDHRYEFWLNRGQYDSFRSASGKVLRPVHVRFKTRRR